MRAGAKMAQEEELGYGDRAGEFLRISRGRYHAGLYVAVGFIVVVAGLWAPLNYGAVAVVESKFPSLVADHYERTQHLEEIATVAAVSSFLLALLIFKDRWRCIEATASNWCSGVMNLSILYVPIVVASYALWRGAMKLGRR
jgi:MFS-type transporter involved in bile tolerance (Atg22 family)